MHSSLEATSEESISQARAYCVLIVHCYTVAQISGRFYMESKEHRVKFGPMCAY